MKNLYLDNKLINKIKKKLFPFYKSKDLNFVFNILEKDKFKDQKVALFVGGCIRKFLCDQEIDDIDVATILTPEELKKKFKNTEVRIIETGIDHGSLTLLLNNTKLEITTLRQDIKTDGRHAEISFTDSWVQDSNRRDFTINAIYMNRKGEFFDPQLGIQDLKNNIVKFIGDPNKRIEEDFLRIIRFIRFSLQYNSHVEDTTLEAIMLNLNGIVNLSKERILNELNKIISLNNFFKINENKKITKLFLLIFPELKHLNRLSKKNNFENLEKFSKKLIYGILLIDKSNNFEYFCHKYKVGNKLKIELNFISNLYKSYREDTDFFKKNIKKNVYLYGKENLLELNTFLYFANRNMSDEKFTKIRDNIKNTTAPKFPFNGKYLISKGLREGKEVGEVLNKLETDWINNNYSLSDENIDKKIKEAMSKYI